MEKYNHHFFFTDTKIEDNSRAFKLQKANFDSEVNTAVRAHNIVHIIPVFNCLSLQKAEAQLAYELQAAKIQQGIKQEELQIQVFSLSFHLQSFNRSFILSIINLNSFSKDQVEIHHEFLSSIKLEISTKCCNFPPHICRLWRGGSRSRSRSRRSRGRRRSWWPPWGSPPRPRASRSKLSLKEWGQWVFQKLCSWQQIHPCDPETSWGKVF